MTAPPSTTFIVAGFALFGAACTSHPASPAPTTSRAELTSFPNLDSYVLVNSHDYDVAEHTGTTEEFSTADGIRCSINGYTAMSCSTPFPLTGTTSGSTDASCTSVGPNSVPLRDGDPQPYRFLQSNNSCTSGPQEKQLPNGSKINYDAQGVRYFTCAADANLVACIDDKKHGFVLQPSRSWTF
ncbi:hypothetical protein FZI85_17795 [Mycobacterium sp. CBMA293]|uniref:hypothetical protein n=1 Tax=unclassified Mycolicibacterium TaxID=2636767 RepID=UPI0012DE1A42|nr:MULTISPECIES: hypothetical protein [unclassified Mycolicibacterium]MUL44570.1 hypothetical protein [Mycolicibacterium sp. CBMA 360]MUL93872.1 hypothetical protein [Mycolicibacterium sp. CBMA 230]MUM31656.1 hypothetical protein [Mycolicibacterium sp. CBMA 361]MUL59894.1 hypothetical protein [Mycolicibacterium sp. CBMA 335]MUL68737.1 hypothetical protein [Mycolicibacterium sp. CBMA 311]